MAVYDLYRLSENMVGSIDLPVMKIFDVTRPLTGEMLVYPGDIRPVFLQKDNGQYRSSELHMSTHSGTHIDAPAHYLTTGDSIDRLPLTRLIGRCRVVDVTSEGNAITADYLAGRMNGADRLLLKTSFSGNDQFTEDYPSLTADTARLLTRSRIQCVGIDSPSIESYHGDGTVHRELLMNGCSIIELLDLSLIPGGDYEMVALPLRLTGLDGSPARVVLIQR